MWLHLLLKWTIHIYVWFKIVANELPHLRFYMMRLWSISSYFYRVNSGKFNVFQPPSHNAQADNDDHNLMARDLSWYEKYHNILSKDAMPLDTRSWAIPELSRNTANEAIKYKGLSVWVMLNVFFILFFTSLVLQLNTDSIYTLLSSGLILHAG